MESNDLIHLKSKKDFQVFINNEDFGIFKYDYSLKKYVGMFGNINLSFMLRAIQNKIDWVKVKSVN